MLPNYLEIIATSAGLINIYLAARANIWNWLFGIITVSFYTLIFFRAKLYADTGLQIIYLILQFYGYYQWRRDDAQYSSLQVHKADRKTFFLALSMFFSLFILLTYFLQYHTDSTTVLIDAVTTALSLVAQWMMSKKWIENWWLWMLVDVISIKMYLVKHLYLTAGLYATFFILCCLGYYTWNRKLADARLAC